MYLSARSSSFISINVRKEPPASLHKKEVVQLPRRLKNLTPALSAGGMTKGAARAGAERPGPACSMLFGRSCMYA